MIIGDVYPSESLHTVPNIIESKLEVPAMKVIVTATTIELIPFLFCERKQLFKININGAITRSNE